MALSSCKFPSVNSVELRGSTSALFYGNPSLFTPCLSHSSAQPGVMQELQRAAGRGYGKCGHTGAACAAPVANAMHCVPTPALLGRPGGLEEFWLIIAAIQESSQSSAPGARGSRLQPLQSSPCSSQPAREPGPCWQSRSVWPVEQAGEAA